MARSSMNTDEEAIASGTCASGYSTAKVMHGLGIYYATDQVESAFAREIVLGRVHDLAP